MSKKSSSANVIPFSYKSTEIRTIKREDGETWFVAKDICDVLGIKNARDALSKIPDAHKGVDQIDTLGGKQKLNVVDEPGLYRLILRSDKPEAEPFMEWVTSEVLPSIRKTGTYTIDTLTPAQQREVQRLVAEKAISASGSEKPKRNEFMKVYRSIKDHFQVGKYSQVPQDKFNDLVAFLGGKVGPVHAKPYDIPESEGEDIVRYVMQRFDTVIENMYDLEKREALFRLDIQTEFLRVTNALGTVFPDQMKRIRQNERKEAAQV